MNETILDDFCSYRELIGETRMRVILFRAKRKDNGKWVYGNYTFADNNCQQCFVFQNKAFEFEVDPKTVGQYTGLTDKNGTKIFEGDIVHFKTTAYHFKNCRIKYQSCYARYCAIDNKGYEYPMDKAFEYEVIGNIHDNPRIVKE